MTQKHLIKLEPEFQARVSCWFYEHSFSYVYPKFLNTPGPLLQFPVQNFQQENLQGWLNTIVDSCCLLKEK